MLEYYPLSLVASTCTISRRADAYYMSVCCGQTPVCPCRGQHCDKIDGQLRNDCYCHP